MTLHLNLKKQWFDKIASGVKTEEYRDIKPYWTKRLFNRHYQYVCFHLGYTSTTMTFKLGGISVGFGENLELGASRTREQYIIYIGERI